MSNILNIFYKILLKLKRLGLSESVIYFIRRIFKVLINIAYPMYFKMIKNTKIGITDSKREQPVIISLTSFPDRINHVWLSVETLLRQKTKPDEIILWLAHTQFKNKEELPKKLLEQQKRGLSIRFCEDLRPHKKYYYTMKEKPNANVIIVDDDMFYPSNLVSELLKKSIKYPGVVICNRGHYMKMEGNKIAPYRSWLESKNNLSEPNYELCPTGAGGVLYPPNSLHEDVFNKEDIYNLCLNADDLWLKVMSLKNDTKAVKTDPEMISFIDIIATQSVKLTSSNVGDNNNDIQFNNIIEKYNIDFKKIFK